jgi:hypothetical protein
VSRRRPGLSPQELDEARRDDKRRRVLKQQGNPSKMTMDETGAVVAHIKDLYYNHHMSTALIARVAGTHETTIQTLMRGFRTRPEGREPVKGCWRSVGIKILAAQPVLVTSEDRTWAKTPPEGTRRRLRALLADGFSYTFISASMGMNGNHHVWKTANNEGSFVRSVFAIRVEEVYAKLSGTRPEDYKLTKVGISRSRTTARKHGWAPSGCWDADTIDDPDTIPEWTGHCGTMVGYRIHKRDAIPACRACLDALSKEMIKQRRERSGASEAA